MHTRYEDELRIAERAAEWHALLSRTGAHQAGEQDCAAFMAWLEESPKHVREFLLQQAWEAEMRGMDPRREIDAAALIGQLAGNVVMLKEDPPGPPPRSGGGKAARALSARRRMAGVWIRERVRTAAAFAAMLALTVAAIWHFAGADRQTYATAIGELRTLELADGSKMELGTASRVRINFSGRLREIELLQGEAFFKVQRDAVRPFRVRAGISVIQALGTQFTVNRRPLGTTVAVLEGRVRVYASPAERLQSVPRPDPNERDVLNGGEQVRLATNGAIEKRERIETASVGAWRQHRLVFRDDALADIAAEFNRHNRGLEIVVEGEAARNKRYGGIFDADDPQAIARFVAKDEDLEISEERGRIVIRQR